MKQIWKNLGGISNAESINLKSWRLVEDQLRSSTRKLVDTASEHELLEQMLEDSKPKIKFYGDEFAFKNLHYLLFTPFRYPPLKSGTRFGLKTERNLLYTSLELETAMFEKAFWRFNFLLASEGNIGGNSINYTAFKVNVATDMGINLCKKPFADFTQELNSPFTYDAAQALGQSMREDGIQAFISFSARCKKNGKNLNVFTPLALDQNKLIEKSFVHFSSYSTKKIVEFYSKANHTNKYVLSIDDFMVNGKFPFIAG